MKHKFQFLTFLFAGVLLFAASSSVWAQDLSNIQVCAAASASVADNTGGYVDVVQNEGDTPDFSNMSVSRRFYVQVDMLALMEYNSQLVTAYYCANPQNGYYFKQWNKSETSESFNGAIHKDSVLSNRVEIQSDTYWWGPFDGDGFKLCNDGNYFNNYGQPCGGVVYTEPQSIGTYEAVFAPIPVRACKSGQVQTVYTGQDSLKWNVTFATSYARSKDDFSAPVFSNATTGSTFKALTDSVTFANDIFTVPVVFKPSNPSAEGTYTANLTVSSEGGASLTVQIKAIVENSPDINTVVTVINGNTTTDYPTFEAALAAVPANATIQLRRDIELTATQSISKNFTLDLNGKVLSSTVSPILNIAGGNLTINDTKMIGQISLTAASDATDNTPAVRVESGSLTMNRGTIAATTLSATQGAMAVQVVGGTFTLNDGLLQTAATNNAAAILNAGGTVVMKAGELQATAATSVATLAGYAGTTTVENGIITATLTGSSTGAAVYVLNDATVNVQRATVTATANSTAGTFAGGLFAAYSEGTLSVSKKAALTAVSPNTNPSYALYWTNQADVTLDGVKLAAKKMDAFTSELTNTFELNMESGAIGKITMQAAFFVTDKVTYTDSYSSYLPNGVDLYRVTAGVEYDNGYNAFVGASYAKAKENGVSMFRIANRAFISLEDALLYAQNNPGEGVTILQVNDYTLDATGYYTLPANATLLIPYAADQVAPRYAAVKRVTEAVMPSPYLSLTLGSGVNLDVYGIIEVGGKQKSAEAGVFSSISSGSGAYVTGSYGWMQMESGSTMTLENGATLYAWGYVTGDGEIEARRGATVREFFHIQDWPGASKAIARWMNGIFPLNQYFIQNVEAPTSYHPGSKLFASFAASAQGITLASDIIQIIGVGNENAMFLMENEADQENTWVRKWYDKENDLQVYDVNSGAHLGSMVIPLPMLGVLCSNAQIQQLLRGALGTQEPVYVDGFDSKLFTLPITSNMKIHLLTGAMDITQATELLPGAEIEVDKGATVTLNDTLDMDDGTKKEVHLYLFDNDQWGNYAFNARANQIEYTPSTDNNQPAFRDLVNLPDAKLNIHGTIVINGKLYTSVNSDVEHDQTSTANIYSTNSDAGTITFNQDMPDTEAEGVVTIHPETNVDVSFIPARLHNTAGQNPPYATSVGVDSGQSYCFVNDRWTTMTTADPFVYDNYGAWYIKPAAYVSIATQPDTEGDEYTDVNTQPRENTDHTYSDAAGDGRLFIYTPIDQQWWEVTLENNLYRSVNNGAYYTYEDDMWVEKKYNVRFVNWDGSDIPTYEDGETVYELKYGDMPKYNGTNPTREENVDYTYSFTGWSPAFAPVTEDAVYTATYAATQRKYTITFLDELGNTIETHFLPRDSVPVCDNLPTKTGYYLRWSPAIEAVTGNQTYQATFQPEPPTMFTITFKNYDGTVLKQADGTTDAVYQVVKGTLISTVYDGVDPTKPATDEFAYQFTAWNPDTAGLAATEDMTFTAQFSENRQKATVTFRDENNNTLSTQRVEVGQTPVAHAYAKAANARCTYTTTWQPMVSAVLNANPITYTAHIDSTANLYTVMVNGDGCVATGVGTYAYDSVATLTLTASNGFKNPVWLDGTQTLTRTLTVQGDITLYASASIDDQTAKTLIVGATSTTTLDATYRTDPDKRYNAFTIEANQDNAGQLINAEYLTLAEGAKAYYKYTFPTAAGKTWFPISVPFECIATRLTTESGATLVLDRDYDIIQYNGATRAENGADKSAWEYLADKGITTLTPGRLYMIIFASAQPSATFTKLGSAPVAYLNNVALQTYPATTGDNADANWNGIANPRLYKAYLKTGAIYAQKYYASTGTYEPTQIDGFDSKQFHFGQPIFVQANSNVNLAISTTLSAPLRRQAAAQADRVELTLTANNTVSDRLFLHIDEEAADEYTIGADLAKMGVSKKVGQMWVNRYNARLCVNTIAATDNVADYPLGISAPKAEAYTLTAQTNGETTVYLLENGQIIADLTRGNYTLDLNKGTTNAYAIRLVQGKRDVPTDIQAALGEQNGVEKVMLNGQLYILREGQVYDATGHRVK